MKTLLFFLGTLFSLNATADIYKRVDADGNVTYTNVKSKGATRLEIDPDPPAASSSSNRGDAPRAQNKRSPTPENFPKIDKETQSARDDKRKEVLKNELESEKAALEVAKKSLSEAQSNPETHRLPNGSVVRNVAKYDEKVKAAQDEVDNHSRNIDLLEKELGH